MITSLALAASLFLTAHHKQVVEQEPCEDRCGAVIEKCKEVCKQAGKGEAVAKCREGCGKATKSCVDRCRAKAAQQSGE